MHQPVHLHAVGEEPLGQVAAVLPGDSGDERPHGRPRDELLLRQVAVDHHRDQVGKRDRGLPAEDGARLGRVADQQVDLGGTHEPRVLPDQVLPVVDADVAERGVEEVTDGVRLAGGDHVVAGLRLLHHQPHRLDVVAGEAPVALGVEVAHRDVLLETELDPGDGHAHLAGHELGSAARRLVVEEDPGRRVHAVGLAVVDRHVVAVDLRHAVRRARPEQRGLVLGHRLHLAEHLRARRLVEPHPAGVVAGVQPHRLQHVEHAEAGHVGGDLRVLPGVGHERHGAEVVDLVGTCVAHRPHQAGQVGQVAGVQHDVGQDLLDQLALGVVLAADDRVDLVALGEQELGEVQPVLPGDAGDQGSGAGHVGLSSCRAWRLASW